MAREPRPITPRPLWVRVDENRVRLAVFVVLFVVGSAVLLASAFVGVPGFLGGLLLVEDPAAGYWSTFLLVWGGSVVALLLIGAFIAAVQLGNAEDWVRGRLGSRDLASGEAPSLLSVVADMALAVGLGQPPRIVVTEGDEDDVNAFALGTTRSRPLIGVTPGFLAVLDQDEQRAVVAALMARIVAGDIMFGTALAALMGPIKAVRESPKLAGKGCLGAAAAGSESDPGGGRGSGDGCVGCGDGCSGCSDLDLGDADEAIVVVLIVIVIVAITYAAVVSAAWMVTIWGRMLQRTSHEKSDAEGMLLLKDPAAMLSAYRKVARSSNTVGGCDPSYDGIFYAATSGSPRVERVEERRYRRLREIVGVDGAAAEELTDGEGER